MQFHCDHKCKPEVQKHQLDKDNRILILCCPHIAFLHGYGEIFEDGKILAALMEVIKEAMKERLKAHEDTSKEKDLERPNITA